jgi:hypothetical protein
VAHPTADDLERLSAIALAAKEDKEVFGNRLRRLLHLGADVKLTKKFLRETMTVEQFGEVMTYYENLMRQLLRPNVPTPEVSDGAAQAPAQVSVPESAVSVAAEAPAAVPSPASSSAPGEAASESGPEASATERDRQRLRAEVAQWHLNVKPEEIEFILQRHPYSRARQLLWQQRTKVPAATPLEAAAD